MIVFFHISDFIKTAEKKFNNLRESEPIIIVSNDIYEKIIETTEKSEELGAVKNKRFNSLENKDDFIKKSFDLRNIRRLSNIVFNKLQNLTPFLEKISWNEFILEIEKNDMDRLFLVKEQIETAYDCKVRIGLSKDKFLARAVCFSGDESINKLDKDNIEYLSDIKIETGLWGIGRKIPMLLKQAGIVNLGLLRKTKKEFLKNILDEKQMEILNKILNFNNQDLNPFKFPVLLSREIPIASEKGQDRDFIKSQIGKITAELCGQLEKSGSLTHTVNLNIKFINSKIAEKSTYLVSPVSSDKIISIILLKDFSDIALTISVKSIYISFTDIVCDVNNYFLTSDG